MASGPLDGVRILEFTQIIAGPLSCMLLADMGAEVIKVEPTQGEPWRHSSMFMPYESKGYQSLNRGKQSLALDLVCSEAQEIVRRIVRTCDVVVINYRPDVSRKLNIDYESLRREKPDLIYVDSTAFGRKGPWAHRPGYDIVAQAASGLMAGGGATTERGHPMLSGGTATADFATGYAIAWGTCAALFHRERTGRGQLVETSLLTNALMFQNSSFMSLPVADEHVRTAFVRQLDEGRKKGESYGDFLRKRRELMAAANPGAIYYRGYLTKDGALAVGCLSASLREKLRRALNITDIRDEPGYDPRAPESKVYGEKLVLEVEAMLLEKTTDEWMEILDNAGVPASPVWFVQELDTNPQVVENEYVVELDHELSGHQTMAAPPLKMSDSPPRPQGASPPLGRDTDRILASVGYSGDYIAGLRAAGVIR
jgi:crotonobetainyl-CoA:carnitine CoA-transferase CaiB-like acyl-CoA transferase